MRAVAIPTSIAGPAVLAGLMLAAPALAAGIPDRVLDAGLETRTEIALTVYNSDLALVRGGVPQVQTAFLQFAPVGFNRGALYADPPLFRHRRAGRSNKQHHYRHYN